MVVRIDNRENKLKDGLFTILDSEGIPATIETLVYGDFIIEIDGNPIVVFERKTLADLLASIKDSRMKSQKEGLCKNFEKRIIVIIVEGNISFGNHMFPFTETEHKSIVTSIINTQVRDGIHVMQTKSIEDTCAFICQVAKRIHNDPQKYIKNEQSADVSKYSYTPNATLCKKVATKGELFYAQMSQIPSVSAKTADALVKKFQDMPTFYKELNCLDDAEKLKILKNIFINDTRRISIQSVKNIIQYMF